MAKGPLVSFMLLTFLVYQSDGCIIRSLTALFDSSEEDNTSGDVFDSFLDLLGFGDDEKKPTTPKAGSTTTTAATISLPASSTAAASTTAAPSTTAAAGASTTAAPATTTKKSK